MLRCDICGKRIWFWQTRVESYPKEAWDMLKKLTTKEQWREFIKHYKAIRIIHLKCERVEYKFADY